MGHLLTLWGASVSAAETGFQQPVKRAVLPAFILPVWFMCANHLLGTLTNIFGMNADL